MTDLQECGPNVWIADGPIVHDMGLTFTTRMTIVKLSNGSVWVESPVPLPFETLSRIAELGPVRYVLAATARHVWRLEGWHTLFPNAELWAPRDTAMTLKPKHLPLTGILGDEPPLAWAADLDQLAFKGSPLLSDVLFLHKQARAVILGDLIQINPILPGQPLRNALFKLEGVLEPEGGVGLEIKWTFTNRKLARQSLDRLLAWDFDKLIIAHGACIEKDAKRYVERTFRWLVR